MDSLNIVKEKEAVTGIFQRNLDEDESIQVISLSIAEEFKPFVATNSNQTDTLFWSDNGECEKYGYEKIEGNWYRYVGLSQEQLAIQTEKEYKEFEKLFRENEDDLQRFMEVADESVLREEFTIRFDNNSFIVNETACIIYTKIYKWFILQ